MKIIIDGAPRYTTDDVCSPNAPDHEVWFKVEIEGCAPEFFYLRASPRISPSRMQEIISKLVQLELAE